MRSTLGLLAKLATGETRHVKLGDVAAYSDTRIGAQEVDGQSFIGVDNLLPNKGGKKDADYKPNTDRLSAYQDGDVLIGNIRPYLKKVWFATQAGGCSGDVLAVRVKGSESANVDPKFLYYLLSSDSFFRYNMQHAKGAKMPRGDKAAILRFAVALPSVDVQREVVSVLDLFTALTEELHHEAARRQEQYAYYRDELLSFGGDVVTAPLGELATVVRGASPRPIQAFVTEDADGVPWIKIGDVGSGSKYITRTARRITPAGALKSRRVHPGDFVLSNSMSFGRPYISDLEGCIHDGWLAISDFDGSFVPDFLYHLLRSTPVQSEFVRRAGVGAVRNLNADIVKAVVVPVPTIEEQTQVVSLLDDFDLLVNDDDIGLPAELRARQLQFEQYRNQLLAAGGVVA